MRPDPEQQSDEDLIGRIAGGEGDAFTVLFRRRRADVYRFALHVTGSPAMAEDVAQDVFLIVMREAGRYQPGRSTVPAWLCGIARNCARQRLERDRRLEALDNQAGGEEGAGPATEADPLSDLARTQRIADLRKAVLALPLRYREVVVLCDLQELSYVEAADALGCAIGTVRSRLHRARSLLAVKMAALECRAAPRERDAAGERQMTNHRLRDSRSSLAGPSERKCIA